MEDSKEHTGQNFETLFFLILFSLFVFASSGNQGSHSSSSARFPSQNELVFGDISGHRNAIISYSVSLPDLQKYYKGALYNTGINPYSIQHKVSDYNRRITQNLILILKRRLSIEPVLSWRLYYHLPSNEDDDLPVLS